MVKSANQCSVFLEYANNSKMFVRINLLCLLLHCCWQPILCQDNVDLSELVAEIPMPYRKPVIRIINGETAPDKRFTFAQVSLQLDAPNDESTYDHQCGGSLVASDMILSAAHCRQWFTEINVDRYDFTDRSDSYEVFTASDVVVHPRYDSDTYRHDFMLIKLDRPFDMDSRPIRLNSRANIPSEGMELTVLGWGSTDHSDSLNPVFPNILQKGSLNYISNDECSSTIISGKALYEGEVFPEMLCATSSIGVDACSGDSGGPLIVQGDHEGLDLLVGLVSWGRGCAIYPGVYSRISTGYDWIRKQICYMSADPPNYLECLDNERDPKYSSSPVPQPTTRRRNPRPTPYPTAVSPSDGMQYAPIASPPSVLPPVSPGQLVLTTVLIEIQLDSDGDETGWYILSDQGEKLFDRPAGTYRDRSDDLVWEVVQLPINQTFFFVLTDAGGNGLSSTNEQNGWFRLSMKQVQSDPTYDKKDKVSPIVMGTGGFGSSVRSPFRTDFPQVNGTGPASDGEVNARNPDPKNDGRDRWAAKDELVQDRSSALLLRGTTIFPLLLLALNLLNSLI